MSTLWRARVVCTTREDDPGIEWNAQALTDFDVDKACACDIFVSCSGGPSGHTAHVQGGVASGSLERDSYPDSRLAEAFGEDPGVDVPCTRG